LISDFYRLLKRILKYFLYFLAGVFILSICLIEPIDRKPYQEFNFYEVMSERLDSLDQAQIVNSLGNELKVGFGKMSITPSDTTPLAGYGAREPMEYDQILDSVFVRTVVVDNGIKKVAVLSAELLIIHPELEIAFREKLEEVNWNRQDVFLSATHSHSSVGGWAEGFAGEVFAGAYDPSRIEIISSAMIKSLLIAEQNTQPATLAFATNEMSDLVKNRLIKDGDEDSWMRNVFFKTAKGVISLSAYAAHATCFTKKSRNLTGDFPSYFHRVLDQDSLNIFSMYMAGAVGSMGPEGKDINQKKARRIGHGLAEQVSLLSQFGFKGTDSVDLQSFRLKVPLRSPQMKVSRNLKIRPWIFRSLFGDYPVEVSVLKMGNTIFMGFPCDFSGELAIPLYEHAKSKGINLIITSFNGGYAGYITKDEWYDLEKYETRTMNWYGPDSGAYFSEIATRIIDTLAE
jgi:neutral ceramidase